ncbi:phage tail tube protein [Tsukamurella ocularis]|uniref:phage tail tube protein n=1 Tax=Tsukamurella ocularis TaxID=1970234 RepID=UPI0039EF4E4A
MTTPAPANVLQPPDSRMLKTVSAGRYAVQINTNADTAGTPTWVFINGISKWEPKFDAQLEDDSDIYGDNYKSEVAAGNGFSVDVEGFLKFVDEGVTDPGLAILLAKAEETGFDNYAHIRYWRRDEVPEARESLFAVKISPAGGKPNELQKWNGSLSGRGRPKNITKPTATP